MLLWESDDQRYAIFDNRPHDGKDRMARSPDQSHPTEIWDRGTLDNPHTYGCDEEYHPLGGLSYLRKRNNAVVRLANYILSLPTDEDRCAYMAAICAMGYELEEDDDG
jgi:hypothetical protein